MIALSLIFVNTCYYYLILYNKEHIAQDLIGRDNALFCLDHPLMPHGIVPSVRMRNALGQVI